MPHLRMATRTAIAVAVLLAGSCAETSDDEPTPDTSSDIDPATWSTSTDPLVADGLVWAASSVVHLADGATVDVGGPIMTYVVAGDGVYFTAEGSLDDDYLAAAPLHYADRDGTVTDTGLTVYVESLGSSSDGRYLGLIDAASGTRDRVSGYPQATAVVLDLTTGERVVETTDGMGEVSDDLEAGYPEALLEVSFPNDDTVLVEALGDHLYALPSGKGEEVDLFNDPVRDPSDTTSPSGAWTIDEVSDPEVLRSRDGKRVQPQTGTLRWDLGWWLDDTTVLTIAISGPGSGALVGPDDVATMVICRVPRGECRSVEGTTGVLLHFPVDDSPVNTVDLRGGSDS